MKKKKLSLKKITITSLSKNNQSNIKGGNPYAYEQSDLCNYTDAGGCTNDGCNWGTLNENCSNQVNCTNEGICGYGTHPA